MGFGLSILLIAIGAILVWGVEAEVSGIDVDAIGAILMIVGVGGLILAFTFLESMPWSRRRTVIREDDEVL